MDCLSLVCLGPCCYTTLRSPPRPHPVPGSHDVLISVVRWEPEKEVGSAVRRGTPTGESSDRSLASRCCCCWWGLCALTATVRRADTLQLSLCSLYQSLIEFLNAKFYENPESGS